MSPRSRSSRSFARARAAGVVAAVVAALTLASAGTWSAAASDCLLGLCLHETTTTTAPPPAPAEPPPDGPSPGPQPGPQQPAPQETVTLPPGSGMILPPAPPAPAPPPPGEPVDASGNPLPGEGDDTAEPPADAGPFPDHLRRLQNSVRRTGPNDTGALIAALAPLGDYGVSPADAALIGFGRFPVAGEARYSHDWWFPRFGPGWRLHMGTDIFAAMGTPVRAPSDGTVRISNSALGGLAVYVVEPNGSFAYLAHLSGIADGVTQGTAVTVGQVVGFVGDSGNARGGSPHLHIEFHPGGGGAVDPKPILDGFLEEAVAGAPAIVDRYAAAAAAGIETAPPSSPGVAGGAALGPFEAPRSALLWASAMSPSGGALALAEAEAARVASSVDWTAFRTQALAGPAPVSRTESRVRGWLDPLTPPPLLAADTRR